MSTVLLLGAFAAIFYIWYAAIVVRKNSVLEALAGVDVCLRQRFDLIPNILKMAKKFMEHERSLMEEITELRTQAEKGYDKTSRESIEQHLAVAENLAAKMGHLMVAVENYPMLKSDQTMVQAMQTYNEVEAQIAAARRFYNAAVGALNNVIQIFPGTVLALMANATIMPFYKAEDKVTAPIDVESILG